MSVSSPAAALAFGVGVQSIEHGSAAYATAGTVERR